MNINKIPPLYTIFILILIISANFLAQLFPCRLQKILLENMLFKHLFGYFTMVFFVVLSAPIDNKSLQKVIPEALLLYLIFILITKVNTHIFYILIILLGICYLITLQKNYEIDNNINNSNEKDSNRIKLYNSILNGIYIIIFVLLILGIIIYMGEKKIEYNKNFSYQTFFFGKPLCKYETPKISIQNAIKHAFS